jgi:hypothetical protein
MPYGGTDKEEAALLNCNLLAAPPCDRDDRCLSALFSHTYPRILTPLLRQQYVQKKSISWLRRSALVVACGYAAGSYHSALLCAACARRVHVA